MAKYAKCIKEYPAGDYDFIAVNQESPYPKEQYAVRFKTNKGELYLLTPKHHPNFFEIIEKEWHPKSGELFYYISVCNGPKSCYYTKDTQDLIDANNFFATQEEAEQVSKIVKNVLKKAKEPKKHKLTKARYKIQFLVPFDINWYQSEMYPNIYNSRKAANNQIIDSNIDENIKYRVVIA